MKRRSALAGLIAAGVLPAQPLRVLADTGRAALSELADQLSLKTRFAHALARNPSLLGYASASAETFHTESVATQGSWPSELRGALVRNGPALHEIGDFRYQHWFDGDGMVQSFQLRGGAIEHRAALVTTQKYMAEKKAGRAVYAGFGTAPPEASGVTSADDVNVANISVLPHHNRLFALWEAGSPYELDPNTLATKGTYSFSADTAGAPFSAHPRVEADGTLWNFGYVSGLQKLLLWHIDAQGKVVKTGLLPCAPISMVHDFVVTRRHLVILVCPLNYNTEKNAENFLEAHDWQPDKPTQVLVVDKNDFSSVQRLELPAQWVFHFSNAWEDAQGVIRFEASRAPNPSVLSDTFRDIMQGDLTPSAASHLYAYQIDTRRGRVSETPLRTNGSCEFPVINPTLTGKQHQQLLLMTEHNTPHATLNQVTVLDMQNAREQSYRYPDHLIPEEHLLVGTQDAAGNLPYVLGTALNYRDQRTELYLYRTRALQDGPIASAQLPYALPLGLHGKFVSA